MEARYKKLVKNTVIFSIGSFGSKVLSFLIVPLYTYVLTTEEYGRVDLLTTTISLLLPFVTLTIQEALFRFVMGKEVDEKKIVNNAMLVFLCGCLASILLFPIYRYIIPGRDYFTIFIFLLIFNSYNQIFGQYLRAVGNVIAFTINGVLVTFMTLALNLLFLLVFKWGIVGYLYSMLLAQIISAIYITISGRILLRISIKSIDFSLLKDMLKYCVPLIPNSLMWWIMSGGNKYIINYYMGDEANGLYSLALKLPTIISMVYSIFFQAWQMSAIEEEQNGNQKKFYENVYNITTALLVLIVLLIVVCVKPIFTLIINDSFFEAWMYVPVLSISVMFHCYSSFFGVVYTVRKETKKIFWTTLLGAIINIFISFTLVRLLGLQGVAIGTCVGYLAGTLVRAYDVRKWIGMKFDLKRVVPALCTVCIQTICVLKIKANTVIYFTGVIAIILILLLYKKEVCLLYKNVIKKLKK